jgi:hypothetical protein
MDLKTLESQCDFFTGKTSDISRQLAFAGIAVIWVFRIGESASVTIAPAYALPLLGFVLALAFDLIQYVYGSIAWNWLYSKAEMAAQLTPPQQVDRPGWFNFPSQTLFYGKVVVTVVSFVLVLVLLQERLR